MTQAEKEKAIDILDKLKFFNSRAGRELWFSKAPETQRVDIENANRDYDFLLELIKNN